MKPGVTIAVAVVAHAVICAASAWATPAVPVGQPPVPAVAEPTTPSYGVAGDPNIDRGFIQPTAMTQPAGKLTYNNYELLVHGLTYGITDRVQFSATALLVPPIGKSQLFAGAISLKWQFLSTPRFHLAAQGSASILALSFENTDAPDGSNTSGSSPSVFGVSALGSYCLREDCSSLFSLNASYAIGPTESTRSVNNFVAYGGSIVHSISPHVKLLAEVAAASPLEPAAPISMKNTALLVGYGVRLHNARVAADLGFMKPIHPSIAFLPGLPFANISYRWP